MYQIAHVERRFSDLKTINVHNLHAAVGVCKLFLPEITHSLRVERENSCLCRRPQSQSYLKATAIQCRQVVSIFLFLFVHLLFLYLQYLFNSLYLRFKCPRQMCWDILVKFTFARCSVHPRDCRVQSSYRWERRALSAIEGNWICARFESLLCN